MLISFCGAASSEYWTKNRQEKLAPCKQGAAVFIDLLQRCNKVGRGGLVYLYFIAGKKMRFLRVLLRVLLRVN